MPRALRSVCLFAFVSAVAVLSIPGCSQQGEGERCDSTNGDADCNAGLTCVPKAKLLVNLTDRCCPAENTESDSRCHRVGSAASSGGSGNSAGTTSAAGSPAAGEGGGGMSPLLESGGAAGTPSSSQGGMSSSSAGAGAADVGGGGADGAP